MDIKYNPTEYTVITQKHLTNFSDYRLIRYGTGYYALQKLTDDVFCTVCISTIEDDFLNMFDLLWCISEADNSINGDYHELNVYLSDEEESMFTEIITYEDKDSLIDQIGRLYELESEIILTANKYYPFVFLFKCIIVIVIIVLFFVLFLWIKL